MKTILCFTLILFAFVMLTFVPNSIAQEVERPIVKVIYFIPNDRSPQPGIDEKFVSQVKKAQKLFGDLMEAHEFERKTFQLEEDAEGNVVVHHRRGSHSDVYYRENVFSLWYEFPEEFDLKKDFYIVFFETDTERPDSPICGLGFNVTEYKGGLLPSSGECFEGVFGVNVIAHELAHGINLSHDDRSDADAQRIYLDSIDRMITSYCAAAWLDVHPLFNPGPLPRNQNTTARMLELEPAAPPNYIRLRFEISDPDGIHMVKLLSPTPDRDPKLRDCKVLFGVTDKTVEFVTNQLPSYTDVILLGMLDVLGNYRGYRFELTEPLPFPPAEDVHIPDPNLAAAIRSQIGQSITTHTILNLTKLDANEKGIKDLTGLEHAYNLKDLLLGGNTISDVSPLAELTQLTSLRLDGNTIPDVSLLAQFTQLQHLYLSRNQIQDITPLAQLTELRSLFISHNPINDITPLIGLTQLNRLGLTKNNISDISPLTKLVQLSTLYLGDNQIQDITPLTQLTELTDLLLYKNQIQDITPLAGLTRLARLRLGDNQINDVSPLAELTNLAWLLLRNNQINDVNPLSELVNLKELHLQGNPIKNRKPLLQLLRKNPDVAIYLKFDEAALPVTLSHFRAELSDTGVILKWTTQSEVDNAGFYIYRSQTRDGEFKAVNPTMIQGAGTSSERHTYTWTDTTAKPNVAYYYRIEDISHAGVREQLATIRMRGLISASGKLTTKWADLKTQE